MKVIEVKSAKDKARLRRIALNSQGLLQAQPFGRGLPGVLKAIKHIGYVQIDTIAVVERAHHHVLYSRVPNYKPFMINQMLVNGDIFEYWTHAAAFVPMDDFRFSLPYKRAIKNGQTHWYKEPDRKLMKKLLARIRTEGPLRSRDLDTQIQKRSGWWDLKPSKKALEQLYMEGDLMVSNREGFQKTYDLTERVLPGHVNSQFPSLEEFSRHLVEQQLCCHGWVSLPGLTYLRKIQGLRSAVKTFVEEGVAQRDLEKVALESGEIFYTQTGNFENALPRLGHRMSILSPFDNSTIQRNRLSSLFQFDYQIECYVPEAKRQYGYFSLPLLYRDEFIGRIDCKAHRKTRLLEIKSLHFENHRYDCDAVAYAFSDAINRFSDFQGCNSVSLGKVFPKNQKGGIKGALESLEANAG